MKKESYETLIYLIKKKTILILLFILLIILAIRADFSCGWKKGKFNLLFEVKNLDNKIPEIRK